LGGPIRSIQTPASIAIRVIEVHNPPPQKGDSIPGVEASSHTINNKLEVAEIYFSNNKCRVN